MDAEPLRKIVKKSLKPQPRSSPQIARSGEVQGQVPAETRMSDRTKFSAGHTLANRAAASQKTLAQDGKLTHIPAAKTEFNQSTPCHNL